MVNIIFHSRGATNISFCVFFVLLQTVSGDSHVVNPLKCDMAMENGFLPSLISVVVAGVNTDTIFKI